MYKISLEYGKCLETGKTTKSLEYGWTGRKSITRNCRIQGILSFFLFQDTLHIQGILLFVLFLDTFGLMLAQVPSELSAAGAKCGVRSLPGGPPGPSSFQYSQKKAKSRKTQMSATVYKTHFSSLLFTVWGSCTSSLEGCWVQMMENHLNFGEKLTSSSSRLYAGRRLKN